MPTVGSPAPDYRRTGARWHARYSGVAQRILAYSYLEGRDMAIDHYSTATAMVAALRRREISATELVELHIARIAAHDGQLNAIPVRTFERARQAEQQADARLAAGDTAPLLGLPLTLKGHAQARASQAGEGQPCAQGRVADLADVRAGHGEG